MYTHQLFNADLVTEANLQAIKDVIASGDVSLDTLRGKYEAKVGEATTLTDPELIFLLAGLADDYGDDAIIEIMQSRETGDEDGDEPQTDEEKATEAEQETLVLSKNDADQLARSARAFAKRLTPQFMNTAIDIQLADEKTKRGLGIMLCDRLYGEQAWDDETWGMIPDPRITPKEAKAMQGRSNKLIPRWTYKDGNRNRVGDWFTIAVTSHPEGAKIQKMIDDIKAADGDETKTPDQKEYAAMDAKARTRLLSQMESRLSGIVNRMKRMVKLKLVMDEINELHATVKAELIRDLDEEGNETSKLTDTIECLSIWKLNAKGERIKVDSFIPSTFLRLNPSEVTQALVKEHGGYWEALLTTKDRDTKTKSGYDVPKGPENYVGFINTLQSFYEDNDTLGAFTKYFASLKDENEKAEVAETLEDVYYKHSNFFRVVKPYLEKQREAEDAAKVSKVA